MGPELPRITSTLSGDRELYISKCKNINPYLLFTLQEVIFKESSFVMSKSLQRALCPGIHHRGPLNLLL